MTNPKKRRVRVCHPVTMHHDPSHLTLAIVVGCGVLLGLAVWALYHLLERAMS